MHNILLISEDTLKSNSEIPANLWGSYLLPAIRTAQEIHLQSILGEQLYDKITSLVGDGSITASTSSNYKALLDTQIKEYLIEQVQVDLIPVVTTKVGNLGTVRSGDEHVVSLSEDEVTRLKQYHQEKADFYCRRLQQYLLRNRNNFKELDEFQCDTIHKNLHSSASCNLWLGGLSNLPIPRIKG